MAKLTTQEVAVEHLHPNPWNPNRMTARTFEAERESIGKFGFIDPVTARPHPDLTGQYQIIDGEHRWRAATELGFEAVPVVVLELGDPEAKKLTVVLNETRGSANTVDLAVLLADVGEHDANLIEALPYDEAQLTNLLAIADLELPDYGDGTSISDGTGSGDADGWSVVPVRVPDGVALVFSECCERIGKEAELGAQSDDAIRNGQVLEYLCATYLAG